MEDTITKDTKIGELTQKYPKAIPVLLKNGLHCIGCCVAHQESLGEGARAHGLTEEQIDKLVKDANEAIKE